MVGSDGLTSADTILVLPTFEIFLLLVKSNSWKFVNLTHILVVIFEVSCNPYVALVHDVHGQSTLAHNGPIYENITFFSSIIFFVFFILMPFSIAILL